ncbi:unnamed protein product [Brassicogethes aeneus]|uniref:Uncharacterized protein n=1 Tax=Brassicogethes aeneus TaxID=1431903 RepID=A0A9P0B193_BRAAE|nr:unnamed protein product [Brassicogethes aeneus]
MEELEELLVKWGCENLIAKFQEQSINTENIVKLNNALVKELIPNIGDRIRFQEKLDIYKADLASDQTVEPIEASSAQLLNEPIILTFVNSSEAKSSNTSTCSTNTLTQSEINYPLYAPIEGILEAPQFPDFDLNTLLQTTVLGNSVLKYYSTYKTLDQTHRNRLVDIIVKHIFNFIVKCRLQHDHYNIITAKIISLFPGEHSQIYYVPAIKKKESILKKSVLAKGKLVDKVKNLLYKTGESGNLRKRHHDDNVHETTSKRQCVEISDEARQSELFLNVRTEPWEDVVFHWKKTFCIRQQETCDTVTNFLQKWPVLNHLKADVLINLDFDKLYPGKSLLLFENWAKFFATILEARKNVEVKELAFLEEDISEDSIIAVQLHSLPYLIPPKGRITTKKGKGKVWKFSIQEAVDSIIIHAKNAADIERLVSQQKAKAITNDLTVQPYVLVVGQSLKSLEAYYVVVDKIRYEVHSMLSALDTCFKIFFVFNARYPPQAEHIWHIIQCCVFKIKTPYDKQFPYVMDIIGIFE